MAVNNKQELNDENLDEVTGGKGASVTKQYPDWLNRISKMVGTSVYDVYDKDGGHGVYLYMVKEFGVSSYNVLMVPENFRR